MLTHRYFFVIAGFLQPCHFRKSRKCCVCESWRSRYDLAGYRISVSDSFGGSESLGYDADNDLTTLTYTGEGESLSINFTYNQAHQQTGETMYSSGTLIASVSESYDADGNPTDIVDTNAASGTIDSFSYAYNLADWVTSEADYSGTTTSYTYDNTGQLIGAGTQSYSLSAGGNPTAAGDSTTFGNELTTFVDPVSGNTFDYTYDAAGNVLTKTDMTTGVEWTCAYDNDNNMTSAVETTTGGSPTTLQSITYEYDAFGNMVKETEWLGGDTATLEFAVDGWNPATSGALGLSGFSTWAIINGSTGNLETRNIYGNAIDQILARIDNASNGAIDPTGVYWTLADKNGSVRDVLDNTPNNPPGDQIYYAALGNIISQTSSNVAVSNPSLYLGRYGYDGYDWDAADQLAIDNARVYDPQSERWLEQDPMGFAAGDSNLYRYVNNAPTNATDPTGHFDQPQPGTGKSKKGMAPAGDSKTGPAAGPSAEAAAPVKKGSIELTLTSFGIKDKPKDYNGPTDFLKLGKNEKLNFRSIENEEITIQALMEVKNLSKEKVKVSPILRTGFTVPPLYPDHRLMDNPGGSPIVLEPGETRTLRVTAKKFVRQEDAPGADNYFQLLVAEVGLNEKANVVMLYGLGSSLKEEDLLVNRTVYWNLEPLKK